MRNQKGITALSMVIAIIIIIIIASFSIFTSRNLIIESNILKAKNEIKVIKDAAEELSLDESLLEELINIKIESVNEYNPRVGGKLISSGNYYYLGFGDSSIPEKELQTLSDILSVRSVENNYIIGIIDTGETEVYRVDGIKVENKYYFSYEEINNINS